MILGPTGIFPEKNLPATLSRSGETVLPESASKAGFLNWTRSSHSPLCSVPG